MRIRCAEKKQDMNAWIAVTKMKLFKQIAEKSQNRLTCLNKLSILCM